MFLDRLEVFCDDARHGCKGSRIAFDLTVTETLRATFEGLLADAVPGEPAALRTEALAGLAENAVLDEVRAYLGRQIVVPVSFEAHFRQGASNGQRFLDLYGAFFSERIKPDTPARTIMTTKLLARIEGLAFDGAEILHRIDKRSAVLIEINERMQRVEKSQTKHTQILTAHAHMFQEFLALDRLRATHANRSVTPHGIVAFGSPKNSEPLKLRVTRTHLRSGDELTELGVFDLYERLFPDEQQLSQAHFCACLFDLDIGKPVSIIVDGVPMPYHMDSELAVAVVGGTAVGLAFYTYYPDLHLILFSYIAVDGRHRGRSNEFMRLITKRWESEAKFKECRGIVFEIEPVVTSAVLSIVERCEANSITTVGDTNDVRTLEAFRRIRLYERSALVYRFVDTATKMPLAYKSPCIDAGLDPEDWEASEIEMWLMFCFLNSVALDYSPHAISALWRDSVRLAIEVIGKSQVALRPAQAGAYLDYMNSLSSRLEEANRLSTPTLGKYFDNRANEALYQRQRKLAVIKVR